MICEQLPVVREGLRVALQQEPGIEVVAATGSGVEVLDIFDQMKPHVVITDEGTSELSGVELTRRLSSRAHEHGARIVAFVDVHDDDAALEFLEAGVVGFLHRRMHTRDLVAAIRVIAGGGVVLEPRIARRLLRWYARRDTAPGWRLPAVASRLSDREREVLRMIATGMTTTEIAKNLHLGEATVRTHTYRLKRKLNLRSRAELVAFAYRACLVA